MMLSRSPIMRTVRCAATTVAPPRPKNLKALNITKSKIEAEGGRTTRNIDGVIFEIALKDGEITVFNRKEQLQYPVVVGAKDVRISIDLDGATPVATAVSFDQLQSVLRGDAVGAEFLNGRVAMVAFLACSAVELVTQKTVVEQALTPAGAVGALALVSLTFAASIAPALAGKQRVSKLFPDSNDSFPDRQLPYYFTALAETLNGRAAMIGMLGLVGYELVKGTPLL